MNVSIIIAAPILPLPVPPTRGHPIYCGSLEVCDFYIFALSHGVLCFCCTLCIALFCCIRACKLTTDAHVAQAAGCMVGGWVVGLLGWLKLKEQERTEQRSRRIIDRFSNGARAHTSHVTNRKAQHTHTHICPANCTFYALVREREEEQCARERTAHGKG